MRPVETSCFSLNLSSTFDLPNNLQPVIPRYILFYAYFEEVHASDCADAQSEVKCATHFRRNFTVRRTTSLAQKTSRAARHTLDITFQTYFLAVKTENVHFSFASFDKVVLSSRKTHIPVTTHLIHDYADLLLLVVDICIQFSLTLSNSNRG